MPWPLVLHEARHLQEAAEIYRRLAAARPDAFEPDLAESLSNLSADLSGLERREELRVPEERKSQ